MAGQGGKPAVVVLLLSDERTECRLAEEARASMYVACCVLTRNDGEEQAAAKPAEPRRSAGALY